MRGSGGSSERIANFRFPPWQPKFKEAASRTTSPTSFP